MEIKERDELQRAWLKSSKEDYKIAEDLIDMKHYQWALFLCHIAIEKVLKASYIKINDQYPPPIHKLVKLATDCKIELSEEQVDDLREMTSFNIEARYPDYKNEFYKKCDQQFTSFYIEKISELRLWLLEQIEK